MELTDAQIRAIADRITSQQNGAMQRQVKGWVRDYLGTGLPGGTYDQLVWDGRRVVGGITGGLQAVAANRGSGQDIPSSGVTTTVVQFPTVVSNPHSLITTGTNWRFTAAEAGTYEFDISLILRETSATDGFKQWSANDSAYLRIQKNTSTTYQNYRLLDSFEFQANKFNGTVPLQGYAALPLAVGDYVRIICQQISSGGWHRGVDLGTEGTWFYAKKIG